MTTLAEHIIVAGAENHPPMLEKSMYDSWASRIRLFIKRKKHGRMMLDSIDNGLLVYPTVEENRQTRPKKYSKLTEAQQLQDDCDVQATNIILHGLPPDVYALVNHQEAAKDIWDRVKMLMKGTKLSYQERECRLYNLFDKFAHVQGETLVIVQQVQGRQTQSYAGTGNRGIATTSKRNVAVGQPRVMKCYNGQREGEGHMARQCTQPKRPRNAAWFKEKLMLAEAQEACQILDEEKLAFLADPGISEAPVAQQTIPHNSAFQIDDLDAYDSDCNDLSSAKAVLMANLSSCDPEVLSRVPYSDSYLNNMINQDVQEMQYSKQTHIKEDFGKRFVTQKELSVEQAFWLKHLSFSETPITSHTPVRIEAPSELLMMKLLKLNSLFNEMEAADDLVVIKCLVLETEIFKKKDFIEKEAYDKLVKSYSTLENVENIKKDIDEIKTINIELEHSVTKLLLENENLRKEREHLKSIYKDQFDSIRKTRVLLKEHCDSLIAQINAKSVENSNLNAQFQEMVFAITTLKNKLRKLKGKNVVNTVVSKPNATIAPRMFKLNIELISPRLKNNRDAHEVYIENTIEYTDTLCEFIKRARTQHPSKPLLESACMLTKHVQELTKEFDLLNLSHHQKNIPKQTDSLKTKDSNKPLLTSTGVKPTTNASGSKPSGNTKNNRITRPPHSNQKNKVEDHSKKFKSSLNKTNSVFESISNALVKHSVKNAKFESIYAIYNKCMFDANHDMYLIDFVKDWKLTGRCFTIVDNSCPLTRITPKKILHLKETTSKSVETPKQQIKVYSCPDYSLVSGLWMFKTYDRKPLLAHELCSRDTNLYTISLDDMLKTSLICLLSKASKTKSWLWHRRLSIWLSHLNFGTLNKLAKDGLARGIPKLKFQKDHLCSACALGKSKKSSHQPKAEDTNQEKLYLLHMDLCGPMRVESINGKKYILVIVDDYSRFTWVKFLRSKDEAPDAIIKCIKNIQVRLNATVRNVRTDNGTEFVN
ncbi:retrovirus-related pol polyprotein from transposon TNT 1-94 [Tanacetum coccineum]